VAPLVVQLTAELCDPVPLLGQRAVRVAHQGQVGINQHAELRQLRQCRVRGDPEQVRVRHLRRHPPATILRPAQRLRIGGTGCCTRDERSGGDVLAQDRDVAERATQQRSELRFGELPDVKRVVVAVLVAVYGHIWRAGQEQPARRQQPAHHRDQAVLLLDVLQRLKAGDDLEAVHPGKQLGTDHRSDRESQVVAAVVRGGVLHGARVDVDGHHIAGSGGEQRGAVALPAGEVEHARAVGEPGSQRVPVVVLVHHLQVVGPGHATFAGPFDAAVVHRRSPHVRRVSRCRIGERKTALNERETAAAGDP
jgi:hypothetical protein